ncbi:MAG: 4a-hydroxytetrahydrobiopterin dehydratase [Candidatus Levybacteria bacterium]|nr:4a-hydroxytetrahydrobiopterin dehydratase [Candidatus Levybacteria bacterium]
MDLAQKHCVPCEGGIPPFSEEKENELIKEIPNWILLRDGDHRLRRQFKFNDFKEAINFVNKVAEVANKEDHHPDICIFYNKVQLDLFTHAVGGLSENDFIMASKISKL